MRLMIHNDKAETILEPLRRRHPDVELSLCTDYPSLPGLLEEHRPDALYTVHLTAERRFTDTTILGASVSDDRVVNLGVDYELMRDLILQGGVSYTSSRFAGALRNDTVWGASLTGEYLINENMRATLGYDFSNRASSVPGQDFRDHTIHAGIKLAL